MGIRSRMSQRQTMPRVRPEVEQNKVQKPELIRALNTRLGLKQSHTTPTIGTELLPVIVVDDLTQQSIRPEYWCGQFNTVFISANQGNWYLFNPPGSGVLCKPKEFWFSPQHGGILNMVINNISEPSGGNITRRGGRRLTGGLVGQGLPQDVPPAFQTACSLYAGDVGGAPGTSFWENTLGTQAAIAAGSHEGPWHMVLPKLLVYPGSAFILFTDNAVLDLQYLVSMIWTEEPLT